MKRLTAIIIVIVSGGAVFADTWKVQHLVYQGGTRALQVALGEQQFTEAFVRDHEKFGIRIGCRKAAIEATDDSVTTYMAIGNGDPISGSAMDIEAVFDGAQVVNLGEFRYVRGAYWSTLSPHHLVWFASSQNIALRGSKGGLELDFSLEGARNAIRQITCQGETS